jgi:glycine oxidase
VRRQSDPPSAEVVVVGAGVIGLTCAWRLAGAGHRVVLLDDGGPAASQVAAGMLAPVSEASFGEQELVRLTLAGLDCFPGLVADLLAEGAGAVELRRNGTLCVAVDGDDRLALDRLCTFRDGLGLSSRELHGRELRRAEPFLTSAVRSAVLACDDLSVDNRQLLAALQRVVTSGGVQVVRAGAVRVVEDGTGAPAVELEDGRGIPCDTVVLAAGARSGQLAGLPDQAQPPVVPVKGHILRLRPRPGRGSAAAPAPPKSSAAPYLTHTVRALVHGREVYLVPRGDGEIVVGATVEHEGFDLEVQAGPVRALLADASEVLPVVDELVLAETGTGLRPGTPDNGPLVGWARPGLLVATGHYRNGVLLSEITAREVTRLVAGQHASALWQPFQPNRFAHGARRTPQEARS